MKFATAAMMICASVLLGGCATSVSCAGFKQINPSTKDVLTRETEEQIAAHNESGEAQGCWQAPR